jgi:type III secretion system YscD/HrpQ family protein
MIAPNHVRLNIAADEMHLFPLEGKVYLDGYWVSEAQKVFKPFQYITLGTTHLIVGSSDETWPSLRPPSDLKDTPEPQAAASAADRIQAELPEAEADSVQPAQADAPDQVSAVPEANTEDDLGLPAEVLQQRRRLVLIFKALGLGGILLLLVSGWWWSYSRPMPLVAPPSILTQEQFAEAKDMLLLALQDQAIPTDDLSFQYQEQQLHVTGFVQTNVQRRNAEATLRTLNPHYRQNIRSQETLLQTCREVLTMVNAMARVTGQNPGTVQIDGYIPSGQDWERVKKTLVADTPGLERLIDNVVTDRDVQAMVVPILKQYQIDRQITVKAEPEGVIARGQLPDVIRAAWYEAKFEIEKALGPHVPFIDALEPARVAEKFYLDARIESVTITETLRWLTLKNGKTYFEGSLIPSGYTVERITKEGVALRRGRERVTLKIGEH